MLQQRFPPSGPRNERIPTMWKTFAFAAAAFMSIAALPAQALPGAPVQPAVSASDVTLVADGCGRGWYRDAYGRCRRMGGGGVVVAPGIAIAPASRSCRPSWWRRASCRAVARVACI